MNKDTWVASAVYGRFGSAIWGLASVAFGLTQEQADLGNQAVTGILGGVSVVLAIVSKVRERKK